MFIRNQKSGRHSCLSCLQAGSSTLWCVFQVGSSGKADRNVCPTVKGFIPVQILAYVLQTVVLLLSFFMIVLILLQRGRGGGLAGAFGGAGGQSAFGAKAGDAFTRITVVVALLWAMTAGVCGIVMRKANAEGSRASGLADEKEEADKKDGELKNAPSTGGAKGDGATAPPSETSAPASTTEPVAPAAEGDQPAATEGTPAPAATEPAAPATEAPPTDEAATPAAPATTEPAQPAAPAAEATPVPAAPVSETPAATAPEAPAADAPKP